MSKLDEAAKSWGIEDNFYDGRGGFRAGVAWVIAETEKLAREYKANAAGDASYNQGLIDGQMGLWGHLLTNFKQLIEGE